MRVKGIVVLSLATALSVALMATVRAAEPATNESAKPAAAAGRKIDFNRDVRPILSDNCYSCHGPDAGHRKAELRLDTKERRTLVRGGHTGRVLSSGHLVYSRAGTLVAVPFDQSSLQVTSNTPTTIAAGVAQNSGAFGAMYATSPTGVLAYVPSAGTRELERRIAWVDRQGAETPLPAPTRNYGDAVLSPDSQQIAATITAGTDDLWIYDVSKGSMSQLPAERGSRLDPVWTPDGRRVAYRGNRDGTWNLYWTAADGTGPEEPLDRSDVGTAPYSWSPDGRVLAFTDSTKV